MEQLDLDEFLPYHLAVSADKISRALSRVYAKHGLTIPEWRVLVQLKHHKELNHSDLSAATNMEKARVTRALILMNNKQLIERKADDKDKRITLIQLSSAGESLYRSIEPDVLNWNAQMISLMGEADYQSLLRILHKSNVINFELLHR